LVIIAACLVAITVILVTQNLTKPTQTEDNTQYITKGSITTGLNNSQLAENYTYIQLLNYCSSNKDLIYNDICIRGLWDVSDKCKSENFSSTNPICKDVRFTEFESAVDKEMHDLDKSLTSVVNSCANAKSDDEIQSCSVNIDRIKNDCTDPRFYGMMTICKNPKMNQLNDTG
jgi:hypothetical protein